MRLILVIRIVTTKMLTFNNVELADVHIVYGFCDRNSLVALREYWHQYPDWRQFTNMFEMIHLNMRKTGTLMPHAQVCHGRHNVQDEENV
jgi:hypothetical protein